MTIARVSRPWGQALLLAAAAGLWCGSAGAVGLTPRGVTEVNLVKEQHEGLRFRWQAVVHERGGVFVLRRLGGRSRLDVVVREASPGQHAYDAWWRTPATSGVYELRYRTASGAETVLATTLVNCHSLQGAQTAADTPQWRPPAFAAALPTFPASATWSCPAEPAARVQTRSHKPLLPPPRAVSRA